MECTIAKYVANGHCVKLLKLTDSAADDLCLYVVIRDRRQVIKPCASYRIALWHYCYLFDGEMKRSYHLKT